MEKQEETTSAYTSVYNKQSFKQLSTRHVEFRLRIPEKKYVTIVL